MARVTWLLPVKDASAYLTQTLASLASQTFKDFAVLAWDNGSIDGTPELLSSWIPSRLPGRIVTDRPMGLGASLAAMVRECETEFCARIDGDDIAHPERLLRQVQFLDTHAEVGCVGSQVIHIDECGSETGSIEDLPIEHWRIVLRLLTRWAMWHPTVVFRRELALAAGNYQDEQPVEDYSLWLRMGAITGLANLPDRLLHYRVHPSSITSQAKARQSLREAITRCVATNGPVLYGSTSSQITSLLTTPRWSHLIKLFSVARHLSQRTDISLPRILSSEEFADAVSRCCSGRVGSRLRRWATRASENPSAGRAAVAA